MKLLRTLRTSTLLLLTGLAVSSCLEMPDYPETPSISFKSISSERVSDGFGLYDRVTITVSFKDGNGDLGLREEDKVEGSPWARLNPDLTLNPFYNNYYITPLIRNAAGEFLPLELDNPNDNYNSTYPPLDKDSNGRETPLRGDLSFTTDFFAGDPLKPGEVVRFEVFIYDRALNKSNTIITDPITIPR
ncbi:hypothetical protein [Hymenobacter qilianensis]|uniref:Lipoprotein n=2 Tax=Hymenobacter qilianensis TaxID=1385715 RepID=A0A7H0GV64_9BACT|nr:hypothetical protein [Hymenobacter qilianensis]QNP52180.1 hypothetical protein H9L05_20295 [Hymenobacter qilianensis]